MGVTLQPDLDAHAHASHVDSLDLQDLGCEVGENILRMQVHPPFGSLDG